MLTVPFFNMISMLKIHFVLTKCSAEEFYIPNLVFVNNKGISLFVIIMILIKNGMVLIHFRGNFHKKIRYDQFI